MEKVGSGACWSWDRLRKCCWRCITKYLLGIIHSQGDNKMSDSLKKLRIFAASPTDVASERAKLETVVESLKPIADYLGLILEVVDWREVVPDTGRPQQIIFDQL